MMTHHGVNTFTPRWEFDRKAANAPQTEPIQSELFSGEALEAPASALVRETIQNSLDARPRDGVGPVRVRFTLPAEPAIRGFDSPWLAGLRPHLLAERNGLARRPVEQQAFSTLLIEDYGTCGLPGDVAQTNNTAEEYRGMRNHFFHFWRAIGSSGKDASERGSWGLGKTVLPASSCINAFFGVSCESIGGPSRLMGMALLRHHNLPDDERGQEPFTPYGRFGRKLQVQGAAMPIVEAAEVAEFCRVFGVTREAQPGLSLVVILPLDGFTASALITSAIVQYFFPIIEGQLVVEVMAGTKLHLIDATTIENCAREHERWLEYHRITPAALYDTLALARWSVAQRGAGVLRLNAPSQPARPRWEAAVFAVDGWEAAAARFAAGAPLELAVQLALAAKATSTEPAVEQSAEFFVCMKRVPDDQRAKTFYLRDGITISGIRETVGRGLSSFVTAEGGPLAAYLRLAENPAHTEWAEDSRRLKERYENHALPLRYVKNSVKEIYDRLTRPKEGIDTDLLGDVFFLEEESAPEVSRTTPGGRGKSAQKVRVPALDAPPEPLRIGKREDGIILHGEPQYAAVGQRIRVRVAYEVRRGNPFDKWSPHDFDFKDLRGNIDWDGAVCLRAKGCELELAVERSDFSVLISGLDSMRDVRVETRLISDTP
jgi:hypothetical protein